MYKTITKKRAWNWKKIINNNETIIRLYFKILFLKEKFENFNAIIFILEISRKENIKVTEIKKSKFVYSWLTNFKLNKKLLHFKLNGIDATKIANAGVGSPLNSYFWSVILKTANLKTEKRAIINETNGK